MAPVNHARMLSKRAKRHLDEYLSTGLGHNNTNGLATLRKVGRPCTRLNEFGFPEP